MKRNDDPPACLTEEGPCGCCGKTESCICPECPCCGISGDPACYEKHGLKYSKAQLIGQSELRTKILEDALADEERYRHELEILNLHGEGDS